MKKQITIDIINLLHGVEIKKVDFFLKEKHFLDVCPVLSDTKGNFWLLDGHHRFVAYCLHRAGYANISEFLQNTDLNFIPQDIFDNKITVFVEVVEDIPLEQFLLEKVFNLEKFIYCFSKYCVFPDEVTKYDPDFIYFYKENSFLKKDKEKITEFLKRYIDFNKFVVKNKNSLNIDYVSLINFLQRKGYSLVVEWSAYVNFTNPGEKTEYNFKTMQTKDLNNILSPCSFTKEKLIERLKQEEFFKIKKDIENKKIYLEK